MFSKLFLIAFLVINVKSVPFVTKRVSLHNPITIDFSGWRPLRGQSSQGEDLQTSDTQTVPDSRQSLDNQFLTVPVAVETDAEHVLSETDLNQIREHVIQNWRQKPLKSDTFPHLRPFVEQLLPKPEVEVPKEIPEAEADDSSEYTFVKMDKNGKNSTEENLFHAYFAAKDHIPPEGYVRLTKNEFKNVFKNAEILFI